MNIGVIGGSGLYQLKDGGLAQSIEVATPYGPPSGPVYKSDNGGHSLFFLARHGVGHVHTPTEINYRANIFALKKLGAEMVVSVSAVGSLRQEIEPGDLVLPEQYIDLTRGIRVGSFFGNGVVGHAHFSDPTCESLRNHIAQVCEDMKVKVHRGGTYVCIEGPHFSTRAESHLYRSWKIPKNEISVIGMTAMPEAKLAREAGLCYQTVAMATDYDCWNEEGEAVTVEAVMRVLGQNVNTSRNLIAKLSASTIPPCRSGCQHVMKNAVMTAPEHWPENRKEELQVILR